MNTQKHLPHHVNRPYTAIRAATRAALSTLILITASAAPIAAPAAETLVAKVSLAGLDLSTSEGASAALKRIRTVALHLCNQFRNSTVTGDWEAFGDCVRDTLNDAVRQVKSPTLAALRR